MLKYGICLMLVVMGLELIFKNQFELSAKSSLLLTLAILTASMLLSWAATHEKGDAKAAAALLSEKSAFHSCEAVEGK